MKYQVGDTVLILHSNEEGEVIDIINDKMVLVNVRGVKFPAYMDQIDFPYFKRFSEKKFTQPKKEKKFIDDVRKEKPNNANRVVDGVWLTFLPVMETDEFGDEIVDELKIHLVNRTETEYNFVYKLSFFGEVDFELKNTIHPFEDFYLHDIPFSDLNDNPAFGFDFSLTTPDKKKAPHYEASLRLKAKQFFTKIEETRKKNLAHFSNLLFEKYPDFVPEDRLELGGLAAKGYKVYNAKEARQYLEPARSVVDLHADKIADDWEHMSNFEILTLQLKTFEKYYDLAVAHHLPTLTIIHGVGQGTLRNEIHEILRLKHEVKSFVNQYDPRFGYGATEIWLKY
jgi:hypothetical protein